MIPIIYDRTKTASQLIEGINNLGIGEVSEAVTCVATEERNGGLTMTMTVPETAQYINNISVGGLLCVDVSPQQKRQLFEIVRVMKTLSGIFTVYAEHISYRLLYSVLKPFPSAGIDGLNNVFTRLSDNQNGSYYVTGNNFTFTWSGWTSAAANFKMAEYQSVRKTLLNSSGSVLDKYGGCYKWNNFTVTLYKERGSDNGVKILYGKNLTDISAEYNNETEATATSLYGIYKNGDTIVGASGISATSNTGLYKYARCIVKDMTSSFSGDTAPTAPEVKSATDSYVSSNIRGVPDVNLKTSFVLLSDTVEYAGYANLESVEIDDTVTVYVPSLDVDVKAKVIKTNYNVLLDRYDSVEVGNFRTSINAAIRAVKGA